MMKSDDDLLDMLRESPYCDGWFINGQKFTSVAITPKDNNGKWGSAICRVFRGGSMSFVSAIHDQSTDAWEEFVRREHPRLMKRWEKQEAARDFIEQERAK